MEKIIRKDVKDMYKLVLIRHGESEWNKANFFTGWTDIDLSDKGIEEAQNAGRLLKEAQFAFDVAYTSYLKRAIKTLDYVLEEMDLLWIPVYKAWQLNERHYGALQGLSKTTVAQRYGEEQVKLWRRSYNELPPALTKDDKRYLIYDAKYRDIDDEFIPLTESLKETAIRVKYYWNQEIKTQIKKGNNVLIVAHGNSLRALLKFLDNLTPGEIIDLDIPTGAPLVYMLDKQLHPVDKYYL